MKYFIDTEFLEGSQAIRLPFINIKIGQTKPTIDLISIGIVAEDGREYYAISKNFNLKEAWNRWQIKEISCEAGICDFKEDVLLRKDKNTLLKKEYWIRENVLKPIFIELTEKCFKTNEYGINHIIAKEISDTQFNYKNLKLLIETYGKTNKQIVEEIKKFTHLPQGYELENLEAQRKKANPNLKGFKKEHLNWTPIEFYAYYADYDWVAFCWLFGKMIDLPKDFPKYCIDLQQIKVEHARKMCKSTDYSVESYLENLNTYKSYPKNTNEHNALADARWNYELYKFLKHVTNN